MVCDRAESMMSTTKRHPARLHARIGCDAGGRLTGMEFDGVFDTGAYASWGPTVANRVPVHASGPCRVPAYRAETRAMHTNNPVAGAFRGFGVPQAATLRETLFDRLAEEAGLDPLEFRRINALADGDRSVCGQVLHGVGIARCLTALAPRWRVARAEAAAVNAGSAGLKRGAGRASCWYGCGNTALPNPSTVRLGITREGRLWPHQGATDIGQGSNTVIAQLAADALGVALGDIGLIGPDTALTPDCGKTSASRQTVVTGKAALRAGRALRAAILARANRDEDAALRFEGGRLVRCDPLRSPDHPRRAAGRGRRGAAFPWRRPGRRADRRRNPVRQRPWCGHDLSRLRARPLRCQRRDRRRRLRHRGDRAIYSYCGVRVKIDTDRHLGPEGAVVCADGEAVGLVVTSE